jgi:hypothetical protein
MYVLVRLYDESRDEEIMEICHSRLLCS